MPHATSPQGFDDDTLIEQVLDPSNPIFSRELEPGEKADDAVDYENLSDDDLADDEEADGRHDTLLGDRNGHQNGAIGDRLDDFMKDGDISGLSKGEDHDDQSFGDLFGEESSSPADQTYGNGSVQAGLEAPDDLFDFDDGAPATAQARPGSLSHLPGSQKASDQAVAAPIRLSVQERKQQELFAMSRHGVENADNVPASAKNQEELLASIWPKFNRNDVPRFMDLLPPKRARYVGRTIPKPPKPVHPNKISLDLAPDQEKSFRLSSTSMKRTHEDTERTGIVRVEHDVVVEEVDEEDIDMESDFENEEIGGVSWQDLQIVCEDWDVNSASGSDLAGSHVTQLGNESGFDESDLVTDHDLGWPSAKRQKLDHASINLLHVPLFSFPSLRDPEYATTQIAKSVTLDLNDSRLLIDHVQPSTATHSIFKGSTFKKAGRGAFAKGLSQRYNISNDEAYDLLKENHQNKVRSMLGNVAVEHSLPAVRLQWPFYKTKLDKHDARSFHRPTFRANRNEQVSFSKHPTIKRKHLKGKATQAQFPKTQDLTMADNASVLLLEYSEEYPTMISNIGMGNRIVNYYRRRNAEDNSRPKLDIGETAVLFPQDKSPFSIFGHVDPGQTIPAIYNSMYRAPIFKQDAKNTDFLVVKNTTGVDGSAWFLRNIDNVYAVGQEFPAVDVPGPHSRKVTTASKNRLKMISYRLIRKNKTHRISVGEVTSHFAGSNDMQNRQKMKEFMSFNKEQKEWQMRDGESIPDEEAIRSMVKPEDVCLLESMQVGQQHLQDAGFSKGDDESEGDDAKEGQSIEQQLAPWYTSRNFINATQGKAMLRIHGDGDPTGRGEAFSFIKTSMKGGFKAEGASANEKMQKRQMKDASGHAYNVQEQQKEYELSIRRVWEAQKRSLSTTAEQPDSDFDDDPLEEASNNMAGADTPRSEVQTPTTTRRRDDETASQFTQHSNGSQSGKTLRITRYVHDEFSGDLRPVVDIIRDPKVIRQYLKRRHAAEDGNEEVGDLKPTDDQEKNKRYQKKLEKELIRLNKNKERRIARDKAKGVHFDGAEDGAGPSSSPATGVPKIAGTQRKCANCGQVGHIKTNKKCPALIS